MLYIFCIYKLFLQKSFQEVNERFSEHKTFYSFTESVRDYTTELCEDVPNIVNLASLSFESVPTPPDTSIKELSSQSTVISEDSNRCFLNANNRYIGKFVSDNVVNLASRNLSQVEVSLLSKGLKFVPTPLRVDKIRLREELETFGRRLRLLWHFRDEEENNTMINPFRPKSKFNPKGKDAAIEIYLSRLEEETLNIDTNLDYNNLTRDERNALKQLKNDHSIVIKEADKGSGVVVWDREDYLTEAESQLSDPDVYEELKGDFENPLIKTIKRYFTSVSARGDISSETLNYFMVNNPRLRRFYLLPKIHKRLFDVPGRPVISNCGYYTENVSAFIDHHL